MSVRLLTPRPSCGVLGKLPGAGDFLRTGVPAAVANTLDAWLETAFAGLEAEGQDWRDGFPLAPAWRFAADASLAGGAALFGVMRPSHDAVGRLFPCLVVATSAELTPEGAVSTTPWFDHVEARLDAAVRGELAPQALAAELSEVGAPQAGDLARLTVQGRSTDDGLFLEAKGGPDGRVTTLQAMLQTAPVPPGASLWWRHDPDRTRVMITPGLPAREAFAALLRASADRERTPQTRLAGPGAEA